MSTYPYWSRQSDPARRKGVSSAQVASYNSDLYRPNDTRFQPGSTVQTGPGQYATPYGMIGVRFQQPSTTFVPPAPTMGGMPGSVPRGTSSMGSGGFSFGATGNPTGNFIDVPSTVTRVSPPSTSPVSNAAPSGNAGPVGQPNPSGLPPLGSGTGVGNAMQRWQPQTNNGMPQISPQKRFFWATGTMDGRAPQANPSNNIGAIQGTFDTGGAHMPDRSFLPQTAPSIEPHQDPSNPENTYTPQQYQQKPSAPTSVGFGASSNPIATS